MSYEQLRDLEPEEFKRFTGVSRSTFAKMVTVLAEHERGKKKSGRPAKLVLADQLLVALQYWREYRPYFHIAVFWGVAESAVCRIGHKVEDALIKATAFPLPGKTKLREEGAQFEVIVGDAAESPVERPQKNSGATTVAKRSATRSNLNCSWPSAVVRFSVLPLARGANMTSSSSSALRSGSAGRSSVWEIGALRGCKNCTPRAGLPRRSLEAEN
jgi:hypothetical protein